MIDNMYIPTHDISIHHIHQYIHKYKTNKIWFNTYLYGKPDYSVMHKGLLYQEIQYKFLGIITAVFDKTHTLTVRIDNGADVSIMPTKANDKYTFLHHFPSEPHKDHIGTGNSSIKTCKFVYIPLEIQGIRLQLRILVCDSAAYTNILLGHDAMLALGMWQDYTNEKLYVRQTTVPFRANTEITIPLRRKLFSH